MATVLSVDISYGIFRRIKKIGGKM